MARDPYRRQIRRARRALQKGNDRFQVVIGGPDEPLGLIALAAVSRWAWRHRTAFVPFGITIAAFAVAPVALIFGFLLAATAAAPEIRSLLTGLVNWLNKP